MTVAYQIRVTGRVQGVGFRPFIYRIAHRYQISGWVQNCQGEVLIHAEAAPANIEQFTAAIIQSAPPLSRPTVEQSTPVACEKFEQFTIKDSATGLEADVHLPPDHFTCPQCIDDLSDPDNRRYQYPFINCTQCGPRYTIIRALPYDRPATSMADFPLCPECEAEYLNPLDRRFHAEPIACEVCGPHLQFNINGASISDTDAALDATVARLNDGDIIAIKGIGGYHLMCDARNETAVQKLRQRKQRPSKPLAVMFPQSGDSLLSAIDEELSPTDTESSLLLSPERPIVLCSKKNNGSLAPSIAPGLIEIGAMLPYSPLHHLLLSQFAGPVVATSGNISGEPVITDNSEAQQRLNDIADAFLHHNRPILRPADDSLYRVINNHPTPFRLGRGIAPLEMKLSQKLPGALLAVGGQMKNCIALAWNDRIVISPHIGDLESLRSQQIFSQIIQDLQQLYQVEIKEVICDAHPGYDSHRIAKTLHLPVTEVFHHHAHASALYGESRHMFPKNENLLVFAWDGTGMGSDKTLWGGESLIGKPGTWKRFGSLRQFKLPGGDKASREPWRSALSLLWETERNTSAIVDDISLPSADVHLLHQAWQGDINTPITSAAGRLFDAATALIGVARQVSYEGEAPSMLEAICQRQVELSPPQLPLIKDDDKIYRSDWSPLIPMLLNQQLTQSERATLFHQAMSAAIVAQSIQARELYQIEHIGLSGGVFQNRVLTELATQHLKDLGFTVHLSEQIPSNDGGLCYGQIIEASSLSGENGTYESKR